MRLFIWGTGKRAKYFMENNYFDNVEIVAFIDSFSNDKTYENYPVIRPNEVVNEFQKGDYILISVSDYKFVEEIYEECKKMGVEKYVIISHPYREKIETKLLKCMSDNVEIMKQYIPRLYHACQEYTLSLTYLNELDAYDGESVLNEKDFNSSTYQLDYTRYKTFEFCANEIINNNIDGIVAELGVNTGVFSKMINSKLKDREMYLFDTFDGFSESEIKKEVEQIPTVQGYIGMFKNNDTIKVLNNMLYPSKCHIVKGLFPNSLTEEMMDLKFAFVSLDVDLEISTYEGLKFFYPRLSEGGYIFVHDYNHYYLKGIRLAIQRYEKEIGKLLRKVPISDHSGTLVITK